MPRKQLKLGQSRSTAEVGGTTVSTALQLDTEKSALLTMTE